MSICCPDGLLAVLYSKRLSGDTYLNVDYVYEDNFVKQTHCFLQSFGFYCSRVSDPALDPASLMGVITQATVKVYGAKDGKQI